MVTYTVLMLTGLIYAFGYFKDFMNGSSNYTAKQEPLSLQDLPALTICCTSDYGNPKLRYQTDFFVNLTVRGNEEASKELKEDEYVSTIFGLRLFFREIQQTMKVQQELKKETEHSKMDKGFNIINIKDFRGNVTEFLQYGMGKMGLI